MLTIFMLSQTTHFVNDEMPFVREILKLIDQNGCVKNADVKAMMGKSPATAKRLLSKVVSAHLMFINRSVDNKTHFMKT